MKTRHLITFFLLAFIFSFAQNADLDRLKSEAKANPANVDLRIQLIEAYLGTSNAEAALIEIMGIERANTGNAKFLQVKGEALLQLERFLPALQTLQDSYLIGPEDRTLKSIAMIDYVNGNKRRGMDILKRIAKRDPQLTDFYFENYKRYYVGQKKIVAKACMDIMNDFAGAQMDVYFPQPGIEIFSPTERLATEKDVVAVLFEVKHVHPVKIVSISGKVIFDNSQETKENKGYGFRKSFKEKISLHDGNNKIKIVVEDIYGKKGEYIVNVDLLAFKRPAEYHGQYSDSLLKMTRAIVANIPRDVYQNDKKYRLFVAGDLNDQDSTAFFESSLFLFDWLSDTARGLVNPDQAKIALQRMFTAENINPLLENWLYKGSNIDTRTIVYLGGAWDNSADGWMLRTFEGQTIDLKAVLTKLTRIPADRLIFIFDGWQSADMLAWDSISEIVDNSPIPIVVILTKPLKSHPYFTQCNVFTDSLGQSPDLVTIKQMSKYIPIQMTFGDTTNFNWEIAAEPMNKIKKAFTTSRDAFLKKLETQKVTAEQKKSLIAFSNDWKHLAEINKFLKDEIKTEELLKRIFSSGIQMKGESK